VIAAIDAGIAPPSALPPQSPQLIAPFVLAEADARAGALMWLAARWLAPWTFARQARRNPLAASFVPCWIFATHAVAHWEGPGLRGIIEMDFVDLAISADPAADALPDSLAPWPSQALRPLDPQYAGDRPQGRATRDVGDAATLAHQRMERDLIATARRSQPAKQRDKLRLLGVEYPRETPVLALVPVWSVDCVYLGRTHRIAVNGATGRVAGSVPASIEKIVVAVAALLALCIAVAWHAVAET
jgi:hypothetical protein